MFLPGIDYAFDINTVKKIGNKTTKGIISLFLMIGVLSFLSVPVCAHQWSFAVDSKNTYYFIDSENILMGSKSITFWVMNMNIRTGEVKATKECTINCRDEIIAVRKVLRPGFFGNLEGTSFEYDLEWYEIPPNSATEAIGKIVCSSGRPRENLRDYLLDPYTTYPSETEALLCDP